MCSSWKKALFVEQRRDVRIVRHGEVRNISSFQSTDAFGLIDSLLFQLDKLSKTLDGFKGGNGLIQQLCIYHSIVCMVSPKRSGGIAIPTIGFKWTFLLVETTFQCIPRFVGLGLMRPVHILGSLGFGQGPSNALGFRIRSQAGQAGIG